MTLRRLVPWLAAVIALTLAVAVVVLLLTPAPPPPRGPEPGRALFRAHCVTCHGADGRGRTWRARLLFLRPGDLTRSEMAALSNEYLTELIRQGGAGFGKPGMPSFGFVLDQAEVDALVRYLRVLPRPPSDLGRLGAEPGAPRAAIPRAAIP